MIAAIDLTGHRYGRLVVLGLAPKVGRDRRWRCRCDCGTESIVQGNNLRSGNTVSCGCLKVEEGAERPLRHGHTRRGRWHPLYGVWNAMRQRCGNPKNEAWADYGGRGITVCERWQSSFENFLADMGERPPGLTLDRIDTNGNYEPGNCRWATYLEQRHNRR